MLLIVCGVSGTGKTTIGQRLSGALGLPFFDADDFHPAPNIERMKSRLPLGDEDRQPWLEALAKGLSEWEKEGGAVLACSALKESYRSMLGSLCGGDLKWVVLHGSNELIADRLASREGHFFDKHLLNSQLDAFEEPDYGWLLDVDAAPDDIVKNILERIGDERT